nr:MFS transporter [Streptomyces lonarensis]
MSVNTPTPAPVRAGPKEWAGLALLLLPTFLLTVDLGVLWLATPYLTADIRPTSAELLWITDIYGFVIAGMLVLMGTLGDRIGRRKLLMLGAALFIVASFLAAYSTSPGMLIGARGLLGIAGAAILPVTLALIAHVFEDPKQRSTAIAMWVTALSLGIAVGPSVGGVMLNSFWWGSVFLLAVPVMALALVAAPALLPESRDENAGRLDVVSIVLFLLAILPVVYGIKKVAEDGVSGLVLLSLAVGILFGVLFARWQTRVAQPVLDPRLFTDRVFIGAMVLLLLGLAAMNGVQYLLPQFLQMVSELSPLRAGLWLIVPAVGLIIGSQLTPGLAARTRPAYVIAAGALLSLIGSLMLLRVGNDDAGVVLGITGFTVMMLGLAPITVLGTDLAVSAVPREKAGSAGAAGQTSYELGLAFGIAVTGSIATAVYRSELGSSAPEGVSEEALAAARDTIGGALATAEELPGPLGEQLLAAARTAFTSGFHAAAAVSAVLAVGCVVVALTLVRGARADAEEPSPPADDSPETAADRSMTTAADVGAR